MLNSLRVVITEQHFEIRRSKKVLEAFDVTVQHLNVSWAAETKQLVNVSATVQSALIFNKASVVSNIWNSKQKSVYPGFKKTYTKS